MSDVDTVCANGQNLAGLLLLVTAVRGHPDWFRRVTVGRGTLVIVWTGTVVTSKVG